MTCSCVFDKDEQGNILFNPDMSKLNLDCKLTWDLIGEGKTSSCFQIDSQLGQMLCSRVKPKNINDLSDIISIQRPGCLEAIMENGQSVTENYILRKNGTEPIDYYHESLKDILQYTQGLLIFQESAMQIATKIAGFNLNEADDLRKAIGKKKPELMAKVKIKFLEGCENVGLVNEEEAQHIFGMIEKSQRYSFNKSHSISYAINAYLTAYCKSHFPHAFFTSYLYYSKDKPDKTEELNKLINDAKLFDIEVLGPDIRKLNPHFKLINQNPIFGFTDVKNVGESIYIKLQNILSETHIQISDSNWVECMIFILSKINSRAAEALIGSGAFDFVKISRTRMLYELEIYNRFTSRECEKIEELCKSQKINSMQEILEIMLNTDVGRKGIISNKKRKQIIEDLHKSLLNPTYKLVDSYEWKANTEKDLLGASITCNILDGCNTASVNCTCKEFIDGKHGYCILGVQIEDANEYEIKKGKNKNKKMGFLKVSDQTGMLDNVVCFSEPWEEYKSLLNIGDTVLIAGERDKKRKSFLIKTVHKMVNYD